MIEEMEDIEIPKSFTNDYFVSIELLWKLVFAILTAYGIKVILRRIYPCLHWFEESNSKYDILILKIDDLHSKVDTLQKSSDVQNASLEELKKENNDLRMGLDVMRARLATLQLPASSIASTAPMTGGPPPPPPPPPPFSLVTPALKIAPPSSVKTDMPKKKPSGPPQFSISQADITKVLQKLKKTSSTARLLGSGNNQPRKTPPRRKLFGRTPGLSRRRSITALSPGGDLSRQRTPVSSISPPKQTDADINGNGCEYPK